MHPSSLAPDPGSYCLVVFTAKTLSLDVGRLGSFEFNPGYYLYTGSARGPGGVRARVGRHLTRPKPMRWHIDFLTNEAAVVDVRIKYGRDNLECQWAERLHGTLAAPISGFGASDCKCTSHLLYADSNPVPLLDNLFF